MAEPVNQRLVPAGPGEAEYVEKRSRFIGQLAPAEDEAQARAFLEQVKKKHYDARHNCWCYLLHGGIERYSDDGEPQGTAGVPMLEVFRRAGVTDVCCVVTRYFGGVLLGAGGLLRAYTRAAGDALHAAGIAAVRLWTRAAVRCPYPLYERVCRLAEQHGAAVEDTAYAEDVTLTLLLPEGALPPFIAALTELSAGTLSPPEVLGTVERACIP